MDATHAVDLVVVRQADGALASTAFHARLAPEARLRNGAARLYQRASSWFRSGDGSFSDDGDDDDAAADDGAARVYVNGSRVPCAARA